MLRRLPSGVHEAVPFAVRRSLRHRLGRYYAWEAGFDHHVAPVLHPGESNGPPELVGLGVQKAGTSCVVPEHTERHFFTRFGTQAFAADGCRRLPRLVPTTNRHDHRGMDSRLLRLPLGPLAHGTSGTRCEAPPHPAGSRPAICVGAGPLEATGRRPIGANQVRGVQQCDRSDQDGAPTDALTAPRADRGTRCGRTGQAGAHPRPLALAERSPGAVTGHRFAGRSGDARRSMARLAALTTAWRDASRMLESIPTPHQVDPSGPSASM